MPDKATAIVPAYNEEDYIARVLKPLLRWQRESPQARHIIVVDDGSKDRTASIAKEMGVKVIHSGLSKRRLGKAQAFIAGARQAKRNGSDILVVLDADLLGLSLGQLDTLIGKLKEKKLNMLIGVTEERGKVMAYTNSGQRAIRMKALEPLFRNKGKWLALMKGYGLEAALNHLIPKHNIFPHQDTNKALFYAAEAVRKGKPPQYKHIARTYQMIRERKELAKTLRQLRKGGKKSKAKKLLRKKQRWRKHFR